jgi:hypothetical protein
MTTKGQIDRKDFLKKAGVGTVAAASIPALFASEAFGQVGHGTGRVYTFVSFSQSPPSGHIAQPRIGMRGCGNFDETLRTASGGGSYVFFDNAKPVPKPLIKAGSWRATAFVSYDTKGLPSYGGIQPGILTVLANVDGIGSGLELEIVCNFGPGGLLTGEEEGWYLSGTPYGKFSALSPPVGITHLSTRGFSIIP